MNKNQIDQMTDFINGTPTMTQTMKDALTKKRRAKEGRRAGLPEAPLYRTTFEIDLALLRKVKYIAFADTLLLRDIFSDALKSYVQWWEAKNYKIKLPPVKPTEQKNG